MAKNYILLLVSLLLFAACEREEEQNPELLKLPAPTQTGANTCGCLLNGKAWIASNTDTGAYVQTIGDRVFAQLYGQDSTSLSFVLRGYTLTTNTTFNMHNGMGWSSFYNQGRSYHSGQSTSNIGTIHFTRYDTASRVMSGTFSFTYRSPTGNQQDFPDQVFTDCRFDFKFHKF
jgi:hypothetical protein